MKANWAEKALEDVCSIDYGTRIVRKHSVGTEYPVYGGGNETFRAGHYNRTDTVVVARFAMSEECTRFVKGQFFLNDSGLTVAPLQEDLLTCDYVNAWLLASNVQIFALGRGTAQRNLDVPAFRRMTFRFPTSIDEQRRIVAKLDAISAQVAAATENRKAKALALKAARSALLQQLCMEPPPGAAVSEWERVPLDEVCLKIQDGAHRSPQTLHEEPGLGRYLYLTSKNIRNDGLNLERVQYCEADFHDEIFRRCNPERGDVLLTKDGANTGNVALNTLDEPFSLLSSVCLLKPEHSKLDGRFLRYYLRSADGLDQVTGRMTGAAIPRIILKTIKSCQIPLPPLDEQRRIVAKLDETTAAIDALESGVDSAAQELDALTASVLSNLLAAST